MEKTVEKLRGWAQVSVTGPQPEAFLNQCARQGVTLSACRSLSPAELTCAVPRRCLEAARDCAGRSNCELKVLARRGASYTLGRIRRRYVLLAGLLAVLMLLGSSGLYIWDIDVVGNEQVPTSEILSALEECGVCIGANWTGFSADSIRSQALERLPLLSFLTVNVRGSRATVIVRERIPVPEMDSGAFGDLVAKKSGVVQRMNVFRGAAAVTPGMAVAAGDVLISGNVPGVELWEKPVQYHQVSPLGQVWARTYYEFTAAAPLNCMQTEPTGRDARSYALILGKNRLNFYQNTGIYRSSCDTIYNVWKLEVRGLFTLPVSLVRESRAQVALRPAAADPEQTRQRLQSQLLARLQRETGPEAQVLSTDYTVRTRDDWLYVTLRASCMEDIAVRRAADADPREEERSP